MIYRVDFSQLWDNGEPSREYFSEDHQALDFAKQAMDDGCCRVAVYAAKTPRTKRQVVRSMNDNGWRMIKELTSDGGD